MANGRLRLRISQKRRSAEKKQSKTCLMKENNVNLLTLLEVKNIYRQEKGKLGHVA